MFSLSKAVTSAVAAVTCCNGGTLGTFDLPSVPGSECGVLINSNTGALIREVLVRINYASGTLFSGIYRGCIDSCSGSYVCLAAICSKVARLVSTLHREKVGVKIFAGGPRFATVGILSVLLNSEISLVVNGSSLHPGGPSPVKLFRVLSTFSTGKDRYLCVNSASASVRANGHNNYRAMKIL